MSLVLDSIPVAFYPKVVVTCCDTMLQQMRQTTMTTMAVRMVKNRELMFRHLAVEAKAWAPVVSPTIFLSLDFTE